MNNKRRMPTLVLLGAAGSGKGTQSILLQEQYGYHAIEAGAIVRAKAEEDSPLGRELKRINESGALAPGHMVTDLIIDYIKQLPHDKPILFDGYPRSNDQADQFEKVLSTLKIDLHGDVRIIWLNVGFEEVKRRLLNRAICTKCKAVYASRDIKSCARCGGEVTARKDDNPEGIAKRLAIFVKESLIVIERYREQGILLEINGEQPVVHVFEDIQKALGKREQAVQYDSD